MKSVLAMLLVLVGVVSCNAEEGKENGLIAAPGPRGIELLKEDGTVVRVLPGTRRATSVDWSPDGDLIAYGTGFGIYTIRPDGSGRRLVVDNAVEPSWSPDGEQLAFARDVCEERPDYDACTLELDNPYDLFVVDADGGNVRTLYSHPDYEGAPAWSPGGDWIAFECGDFDLCVVRPDGTARRRIRGVELQGPAWAPDGEALVGFSYSGEARKGYDLVRVDPETGAQKTLAPRWGMDWAASPSPDGTRVAFLANSNCLRTGGCTAHEPWEVWVMDSDGRNARRITAGGYGPPAWGPA